MRTSREEQWPLVGRAEELALIEDTLCGPLRSIVIAGEAGVGKTRLAAEFVARANRERVVRVAASTSLRAVPLGAFGAQLSAANGNTPRQLSESLRLLAQSVAPADGPAPLVWADDAHLLDDLSAGLVLELAAGGRASVVATLRSGEPCPDAIRRLWRDRLARRLELQPIGQHDMETLLTRVLGAPPDGATQLRMWNASRGNLLYLRELIRIGLDTGALAQLGEVWIWKGPLRISRELQELVGERVGGLSPDAYAALEAIALSEPVALAVAERLGITSQLVDLERNGLIASEWNGAQAALRLSHPLFGEVLRAGMSPLREQELARAHAAALAATGGKPLRIAIAQLDGHLNPDPALLLEAARHARAIADHPLATRLARAAIAARGGARAILAYAESLFWEQRYEELIRLLDENPIDAGETESRILALHHRASALYWGFGRAEEALDALQLAESIAPDTTLGRQAAGQRAMVLTNAGRSEEAIALARRLLADPHACAPEKVYAYSAVTVSLAQSGRFGEALAHAREGMPLALRIRDELPATGGGILIGAAVAWFLSGEFDALEAIIGAMYRSAAERGDPFLGVWAHLLARSDLTRGRLADAERRASEAVSLLRLHDPGLLLPWALAVLAQVAAQRGETDRAVDLVRELDACPCRLPSCDAEHEMARAWGEAVVGDRLAARRHMIEIARAQHAAGLHAPAAFAAHEAARLGAAKEAAAIFGMLEGRLEGPLLAAWMQHVRALAARDPAALEAAAQALAGAGAELAAAEAEAIASTLHRDAGRRSAAQRAAARALQRAATCGDPRTPTLNALRDEPIATLTPRELHIARLAASGRTRREIAGELALSMRTVSNHLNHIYSKLGVTDRASLAAYLAERNEPTDS